MPNPTLHGLERPINANVNPSSMSLRSLHIWVGVLGTLAFLATGLYMAFNFPELYGDREAVRYMFRANHAYILLASLINIALGIYRTNARAGWRGMLASTGSALLLAAPFVLLFAFFFEAPRGTPERIVTTLGILMLLLGVLAQWPNRPPKPST